jgi:sodium transport system permease protein
MTRGGARFLRDAFIVFANEIRIQFRDGHVLISALLLPLLLYPLIVWATGEFINIGRGRLEKLPSRIGVAPSSAGHPILKRIAEEKDASIRSAPDGSGAVIRGELDAYVGIEMGDEGPALALLYDGSRPRSIRAKERLDGWIETGRREALAARIESAGARTEDPEVFEVERTNVATPKEMGGYLLGILLPITMIAMTSMGAFYPAIDVLVGERERKTLESILSTGASRLALVAGKYLAVVAAALIAGSLNLGSMILTALQFLRSLGDVGSDGLSVPLGALPVLLLGALLLGALLGAAMVLLASLARTFKEGQSLVTPFYSFTILPAMLTAVPGIRLDWRTALVPVMNVALLMKGALQSNIEPSLFLLVVVSNVVVTAALLAFAGWLFHQEDVLVGDAQGSLSRYLRRRAHGPAPRKASA